MRTTERLRGLKAWAEETLCKGRLMKTPAPDFDITRLTVQEPKTYLFYQPAHPDTTGLPFNADPISVTPGILIMPAQSCGKYVEMQRFDRYNNVHRAQEMGQELAVQMLFSVYEPGIRLPGFHESARSDTGLDMSKLIEGTEAGGMLLMDWMDDCMTALLHTASIPHTDLFLKEADLRYSLYTDQNYVVDKRPIFYGFINANFNCYADDGGFNTADELID